MSKHKCYECENELTVICPKCNELEDAWLEAEGKISTLEHKLKKPRLPIAYTSKEELKRFAKNYPFDVNIQLSKEKTDYYNIPLYLGN